MIKVKEYRGKKEFEKDSKHMAGDGWRVINVDTKQDRPLACCFPLIGFFAFLKQTVYMVTYER